MDKKENQIGLISLGLFVAIGLAIAGYYIGQTLYNAKVAINTAEVKGLAERRVVADRANWTIAYKIVGKSKGEIPNLYIKAEDNKQTLIKLLKESGFEEEEIQLGVLDYEHQEYRDKSQKVVDESHTLIGTITVESEKVKQVRKVRSYVNRLISQGINIENKMPTYYFTKLNKIKPDMLSEATKNARIAANEFAKNAGVNVGSIRSARQGNFDVRDVGMQYGATAKIEKDVRVVTTITFYLTE